jgi:hypothetical protein
MECTTILLLNVLELIDTFVFELRLERMMYLLIKGQKGKKEESKGAVRENRFAS